MTADLVGSCKLSAIEKRFSDRFINVGIAEQNMITIAAGLAHEGMRPFVHTFSVFASLRACEQIRTDVFYNKANVKIIGTHCGFSSAIAGPTHFSLEDVGVISSMPGSRIFTPADAVSAAALIEKLYQDDKPAYIRLDRNPIPVIYGNAIAMPFAKDFGWAAELKLEDIFDKIFSCEWGCGYPPKMRSIQQTNGQIFNEVKKNVCKSPVDILKSIDHNIVTTALSTTEFRKCFENHARDSELTDYVRKLLTEGTSQ